jgi:hypothetical protein
VTDIDITSLNLARGIKTKNIVVPSMMAQVTLKNPPKELEKAVKADKAIIQQVGNAAFAVLKKASDGIRATIEALDDKFEKTPPDPAVAEKEAKGLASMCHGVADAQGKAAAAAALKVWTAYANSKSDLKQLRINFTTTVGSASFSLGSAVAKMVASHGVYFKGLYDAAKAVYTIGDAINTFFRDIDTTEAKIIDVDSGLERTWNTAPKLAKAEELAKALGTPFLKTIGTLEALLKEYNAKLGAEAQTANKLYEKAKELMAKIENAPDTLNDSQKKQLAAMGVKVTGLLDKIGDALDLNKKGIDLYNSYTQHCATYKAMRGEAVSRGMTVLGWVKFAIDHHPEIFDIAKKLA